MVQAAIIGALYVALTLFVAPLSFGAVQFRFAEALTILPVFTSAAIPGLTVGCLIANIIGSPFAVDAVFGTFATFLAAVLTRKTRNILLKSQPVLSTVFPVILNGIIVGLEICLFTFPQNSTQATFVGFSNISLTAFLTSCGWVMLGEFVCCCILGLLLYNSLKKTGVFDRSYFRTE